jgi:flagellar biosynthesis protein FlhF
MQVKRYVASTFAEALIQAKNELGTDAMIVEHKKLFVGGFLGLFRRQITELTMAVDQPVPIRPKQTPGMRPEANSAALGNLEREVAGLRTAIGRLVERNVSPNNLQGFGRQVCESLTARGVEPSLAQEIGQRVEGDGERAQVILRQQLARLLGPCHPIAVPDGERRVVALIGPTGVGKTTTLAKLAAHFTLEKGKKVALITSDTFRIAAIDQLRTYADILGVPLYAVDTPEQVAQALQATSQHDLILVDTGGRSHRDEARMQELRELLALLQPHETHLVYALTTNQRDAFNALDHYLPLGVNRLTFTKLDEATSPGMILNLRLRCKHPLGYVTHGQVVPDDITPADQLDLPKIMLGG